MSCYLYLHLVFFCHSVPKVVTTLYHFRHTICVLPLFPIGLFLFLLKWLKLAVM